MEHAMMQRDRGRQRGGRHRAGAAARAGAARPPSRRSRAGRRRAEEGRPGGRACAAGGRRALRRPGDRRLGGLRRWATRTRRSSSSRISRRPRTTAGPGQIVAAYHLGLMHAAMGDDQAAADDFARAADAVRWRHAAPCPSCAPARWRGSAAPTRRWRSSATASQDTYGDPGLSQASPTASPRARSPSRWSPRPRAGRGGGAVRRLGPAGARAEPADRAGLFAARHLCSAPDLTEAQLLIAQILDGDGQYDLAIAAYEAIPTTRPRR